MALWSDPGNTKKYTPKPKPKPKPVTSPYDFSKPVYGPKPKPKAGPQPKSKYYQPKKKKPVVRVTAPKRKTTGKAVAYTPKRVKVTAGGGGGSGGGTGGFDGGAVTGLTGGAGAMATFPLVNVVSRQIGGFLESLLQSLDKRTENLNMPGQPSRRPAVGSYINEQFPGIQRARDTLGGIPESLAYTGRQAYAQTFGAREAAAANNGTANLPGGGTVSARQVPRGQAAQPGQTGQRMGPPTQAQAAQRPAPGIAGPSSILTRPSPYTPKQVALTYDKTGKAIQGTGTYFSSAQQTPASLALAPSPYFSPEEAAAYETDQNARLQNDPVFNAWLETPQGIAYATDAGLITPAGAGTGESQTSLGTGKGGKTGGKGGGGRYSGRRYSSKRSYYPRRYYSGGGSRGGGGGGGGGGGAAVAADDITKYGLTQPVLDAYKAYWGHAMPVELYPLFQSVLQMYTNQMGRLPQVMDWQSIWSAVKTAAAANGKGDVTDMFKDIPLYEPIISALNRPPAPTPPQIGYAPAMSF